MLNCNFFFLSLKMKEPLLSSPFFIYFGAAAFQRSPNYKEEEKESVGGFFVDFTPFND
ncbi:hypothetical protein CASFOL_019931 [Castilleja foliolosa]|uniref:Uncharacterized protein n=1 Tax=Castilleja foliolosa TaxID=1961234 RepID=A0ABD3D0Q3_9LAMI